VVKCLKCKDTGWKEVPDITIDEVVKKYGVVIGTYAMMSKLAFPYEKCNCTIEIDIIRTSSSRPELLKRSTDSLMKNTKFSGVVANHIIHEDAINEEKSRECIDYIVYSRLFNKWKMDYPAIGQALSLSWCINQTESPYILSFEDDWVVRDGCSIDIDLTIELMEKYKDINQICFHKRPIAKEKSGGWKKKQIERDGIFLVTNAHWAFQPSIMRTSFLKKYWGESQGGIWLFNDLIKQGLKMPDADWIIENIGTYFLGSIGSGHYLDHIGDDKSVRKGHIK